MGFIKERARKSNELAREEVADRITLKRVIVRNPHGRILIPQQSGKPMDIVPDAFDANLAAEILKLEIETLASNENRSDNPAKSQTKSNKKQPRPFRRCVRVFQPEDFQPIKDIAKTSTSEVKKRIESGLKAAETNEGFRQVPSFRGIGRVLARVQRQFCNFAHVLEHMKAEMSLAGASKSESFRITPMLLDGPPGVGKTAFAQQIATVLGLPFRKLSAGGLQHAFILTGSSTHWGTSQSGEVFNMIGRSKSACGVLLIDEVDKISNRQEYAILPALLDLLEPESAKHYVDESLGLKFDASRLIILMTSNRMGDMDSALLSRCRAFTIGAPGAEQKVLIAQVEHDKRNAGLPRSRRLELDIQAVKNLAEANIDIRALIRAVAKGFANALVSGEKIAKPILEEGKSHNQQIGFVWDNKSVH